MVLHGDRKPGRVKAVAERVFYPLWDAGLSVGHAVRTLKEALAEARSGVETATALLEARLLDGDAALFQDLETKVADRIRHDPVAFIRRVAGADAERHARHGSAAHRMEPDLKEGSGGLRDVHSVAWAGHAAGLGTREALTSNGLLRASEARALEDAEEFLVRVRSALHLETGKRTDRLILELQPRMAQALGFDATAGLDAADALMRALFGHARHVEHVRALALERIEARIAGRTPQPASWPGASDPEAVMEAFAAWAGGGPSPSAEALDLLEHGSFEPPDRWSPETLGAFVRILAAGEGGARVLETMDRIEVLSRFVPEWSDVRCRPQRDPYHTYTVDLHLIRAAAEAVRLLGSTQDEDPVVAEAARLADPETLLLAAFLHDAGKVGRGDHVQIGVEIAGRILGRMGVGPEVAADVRFLVEEHLLLADTATRRDVSDPELVREVAARVGNERRLALLYLLTLADAEATGPHARTPWRMGLVRELVARVDQVLERGDVEADDAVAGTRLPLLRAALAGHDRATVDRFLEQMPLRYLASVDGAAVARHLQLVSPSLAEGDVRTHVAPGASAETFSVAVAARDRPGLLSSIAGAMALSGLSILSAHAFTSGDGLALDLFEVQPAFHGDVDDERWSRFERDLRQALHGGLDLAGRVAEKQRHYPRGRADAPLHVSVHNDASGVFTVVEVSAADRVGLLYELTHALRELGLDVHLAKVATYGERVIDAFYVRSVGGEKIADGAEAERVREGVTRTLAGPR
ncbi:MAG: HD domain-containing protein [Actinobacteria bacterium]|nr:HD domain-containing protein [Actinomycetota bacterium]